MRFPDRLLYTDGMDKGIKAKKGYLLYSDILKQITFSRLQKTV